MLNHADKTSSKSFLICNKLMNNQRTYIWCRSFLIFFLIDQRWCEHFEKSLEFWTQYSGWGGNVISNLNFLEIFGQCAVLDSTEVRDGNYLNNSSWSSLRFHKEDIFVTAGKTTWRVLNSFYELKLHGSMKCWDIKKLLQMFSPYHTWMLIPSLHWGDEVWASVTFSWSDW